MSRVPYLGNRAASTGRVPYLGGTAPQDKHRKFWSWGTLKRIPGQTASDLEHAAINVIPGVYQIGRAMTLDEWAGLHGKSGHHSSDLALAYLNQLKQVAEHPLRNPGLTFLNALPVAAGVARAGVGVSAARAVVREGGGTGAAVRAAAARPNLGPRTLKVGPQEVHPELSRSAYGQLAQKGYDTGLTKLAARKPGGRAENFLFNKIGKINMAEAKQIARTAKGPALETMSAGRKAKTPGEQKALEVVAEEAPLEGRITAAAARVIGAHSAEGRARHQTELDLLHAAKEHLTVKNGKPAFAGPHAAKLEKILEKMRVAAGPGDVGREGLFRALGLLTEEAARNRKTMAGRVALGARYEQFFQELPTEPRVGMAVRVKGQKTIGRVARFNKATGEVTVFQPRFNRSVSTMPGELETVGKTVRETTERPRTTVEAQDRLAALEAEHNTALDKIAEQKWGALDKRKEAGRAKTNQAITKARLGKTKTGRPSGAIKPMARRELKPSLLEERRAAVEKEVNAAIEKNPTHPQLAAWRARQNEMDTLFSALRNVSPKGTPEFLKEPGVPAGNLGTVTESSLRRINRKGGIVGHEEFTASDEAIRIPDEATRRGRKTLRAQGRVGAGGTISELRPPGSITHEYTGKIRSEGLRRQQTNRFTARNSTTNLVGESALEGAKYAAMAHVLDWAKPIARAQKSPLRPDDIAVRLENLGPSKQMPLAVQKFLADPEEYFKTATAVEHAQMLDRVRQYLFMPLKDGELHPGIDASVRAEFERLSMEGKIGFVPKRVLGDLANPSAPLRAVDPGKGLKTVDAINNASRFAILYLKPAYALPNILGNTALNIVQQGFAAPRNLAQSARLYHRLEDADYARADAIMGEGVARAISAQGEGRLAGAVNMAAGQWSKVVDVVFRRASLLHEIRMAGHKTPKEIHDFLHRPPTDPELVQVGIRANREIIDYENLGPLEREIIRRAVFFYPWVKGSTVYSGRFLREHPVWAGAVGVIGPQGQKYSQENLPGPSYLEGMIPVGKNRAVNPMAAAILQQPAQVGMAVEGLMSGNIPEVANAANFYTPAVSLALAELQRRNPDTGIPYKPGTNAFGVAANVLGGGLPQYRLYQNIRAALSGQGGSKLYPPSVGGAVGQFGFGGIYPRTINRQRLAELKAREQSLMRYGR